jgi:hypothetical protein
MKVSRRFGGTCRLLLQPFSKPSFRISNHTESNVKIPKLTKRIHNDQHNNKLSIIIQFNLKEGRFYFFNYDGTVVFLQNERWDKSCKRLKMANIEDPDTKDSILIKFTSNAVGMWWFSTPKSRGMNQWVGGGGSENLADCKMSLHFSQKFKSFWNNWLLGFEVLTAVIIKSLLWDIAPCGPLKINRRFRGTYRLYLQDRRISRTRYQHGSRWRSSLLKRRLTFSGLNGVMLPEDNSFQLLVFQNGFCSIKTIVTAYYVWLANNRNCIACYNGNILTIHVY